jgi:hypothetical protein
MAEPSPFGKAGERFRLGGLIAVFLGGFMLSVCTMVDA